MTFKCPKCGTRNPSDSKYCKECATALIAPEEIPCSHTKTLETPKEALPKGTIFANRYEIIEVLGKGGMGKVYKALDKEINDEVAIKFLKPEIAEDERIIERFRNELKIARSIAHKNVCKMYHLAKEEETPYITMEYVTGVSLKEFIHKKDRLPEDEAIDIAQQICRGLSEAHELGVVHRDLKPQNIMIDSKGSVKIMDFGIARSSMASGITLTGMIIGTPDYMSPEQAEGREADQRSDIYSLGVILYEMVTGGVPFEGDSALSIAVKHKTERAPDPGELNEEVTESMSAVILKCLEKETEQRYQSAEELIAELNKIKKDIPTDAVLLKPQDPAFLAEADEEPVETERPVFVAREQELSLLEKYLDTALSGKGQVVFVKGEAGNGKTALIQEFTRRAQEVHSDLIAASGKCNAHTGIGDPYLPFIEIFNHLTGDVETKWAAGTMTKEHALRLWNLVPLSAQAILDKGPDLINTFIPGSGLVSRCEASTSSGTRWLSSLKKFVERKTALPPDSTLQQSNLFEQCTRVFETLSQQQPLIFVLDDLQWVDAGSASLLFHLGRRIAGRRILIIGAFRPSEVDEGRAGQRHPLEPVLHEFKRDFGAFEVDVGRTEGRQFIDAFLDSEQNQLGTEFRDTLYKQTRGHPLFTVELLRDMQDSGVLVKDNKDRWVEGPDLNWRTLPARVDAVIEERVSRLNDELKEVLTLASVEGEEFTAEVVASLQEKEVRKLIRLLSSELDKRHHLVSAKGIRQLTAQRLSLYLFQHILFQRYLYNSLDEVEKAHLHEQVGTLLETLYGEQADEIAVQLARHFEEAGIVPKAIEYLQKAGQRASQLSAHLEAITHFNKCLNLLNTIPDTPERAQGELMLRLGLAAPLQATKGLASPEVGQTLARVQELIEQLGEAPQVLTALGLLAQFYALSAEYHKAIKLYDHLKKNWGHADVPIYLLGIPGATWPNLNFGQFSKARAVAEEWMDVYSPEEHAPLAFVFGWDLGVIALSVNSWALWYLGYPDRSGKSADDSVSLARKLDHPHSITFAITFDIVARIYRGKFQGIKEMAEELIQLSAEKGFIYWEMHGVFYYGYMQSLEGQLEEGIAKMHQALDTLQAIGAGTCFTRLYTRIMEAHIQAGQSEEGLAIYDKAMEVLHRYDELYCEAELYRLKGELLLMGTEEEKRENRKPKKNKDKRDELEKEAEALFQKAIDVSRKQQAKSWELRAVMSLSCLWQKQGKKEEARRMLEEVYNWFSEGFDTADLKEAKALLGALS